MNRPTARAALLLALAVALLPFPARAQPETTPTPSWQITRNGTAWQLLRDGQPFVIRGAVAPNRFELLRDCGGNAVRTSASRNALDAAQTAGLVALANLPIRAERSGMNWDDPAQVEEQRRRILGLVTALKDHPAVAFWALGNELDHIPGNKPYNRSLWRHLNEFARAIKQVDPKHPVLTVVGTGEFEGKIQEIAAACTDMDLLGINAYGDIARAAGLARQHWSRPYLVTEWGPTGHWEVPRTAWRAPIEQTSSEKARVIADRYENVILADRDHCLGSFVFYWAEKQETTHTWYGLFLNGLRTESIDVMQHAWTGQWPSNRAPAISGLRIEGQDDPRRIRLKGGEAGHAEAMVVDPEGDPLTWTWDIRPEVVIPAGSYAGQLEKPAQPMAGLIDEPAAARAAFRAPTEPGAYRLFVAVTDGQGHVAYGNVPFLVEKPGVSAP